MPVWMYWTLFLAVVVLSIVAASWLDARDKARPEPALPADKPFERTAPREIAPIDVPPDAGSPPADGIDEIVPGSRSGPSAE